MKSRRCDVETEIKKRRLLLLFFITHYTQEKWETGRQLFIILRFHAIVRT